MVLLSVKEFGSTTWGMVVPPSTDRILQLKESDALQT